MAISYQEQEEKFLEKFIKRSVRLAKPGFGIVGVNNTNNSAFAFNVSVTLYEVPLGTLLPVGSKVGRGYVEFNTFTYTKPSDGEMHRTSKFFWTNRPKWVYINPKRP